MQWVMCMRQIIMGMLLLSGLWLLPMMASAALFEDSDFTEETLSRPDGAGWSGVVGLAFNEEGSRIYAWERDGKVWIIDQATPVTQPLLDISDEVLAWRDHGLLGFALDPDFNNNGYLYLNYGVDRHHLLHCSEPPSGVGAPQCDQDYDPSLTIQVTQATIGRITRYTAIKPAGQADYRNATSVDYGSRKVLLGETASSGFPLLHQSHSSGQLVFGTDGSLLAAFGDGASYASTDTGSAGETAYQDGLNDGIITPEENVGSYRSQMPNSLNGKIVRLDPESGDGLPGNPYFDAAAPRAPKSRVWALGLRNPYRMSLKPGTGSHNIADGDPGVLFVGDVGNNRWEEFNVVSGPGQNFGWPLFEGIEPSQEYQNKVVQNQIASQVLGCTVNFGDLLKQAAQPSPGFANPCGGGSITQVPVYVHQRPQLDWFHGGAITRYPAFDGAGNSVAVDVGDAVPGTGNVLTQGQPFFGNASTGGVWYQGSDFPTSYQGTYFHGDFGGQWIRNFVMTADHRPAEIRPFLSQGGGIVFLATHPTEGQLYYISWASFIHKVSYAPGGNRPPTAVASATPQFGPSPLSVQLSSGGSSDPEGGPLSYWWNFDDGASSGSANPVHQFSAPGAGPASFQVQLTVTDSGSPAQSDDASVLVSVNNTPPSVTITSPVDGSRYPLSGDTLYPLQAQLSDNEHSLAELSCAWQTVLHHNNHTHSDPIDSNCSSQVQIAPVGCDGETYFFRIHLTVTDAHGLATHKVATLYPDCGTVSPPVANDDNASVALGSVADIDLLANDSDDAGLDYDSLTLISQPASGLLTVIPGTGRVSYQPSSAVPGSVSFQYTVQDSDGYVSAPATVTIDLYDNGSSATVATAVITPNGGSHTAPLTVSLSSATAGASLYYTLDGSDPNLSSATTTGTVTLNQSATLKVWAYHLGFIPSAVAVAQFDLQQTGPQFPLLGLVGYWPMNEGGGSTVNDESGSGWNGQLSGGSWTAGWDGQGLRFNGSGDQVVVSHQPGMAFADSDSFTLSAWVDADGHQGGWAGLVTHSRDQSPWYGLWISAWDVWTFGGSSNLYGSSIDTGWQHLSLVQDGPGGVRRLYLNGELVASGAAQAATGGGDLRFGGAGGVSEFFSGVLDEVRLYNRALDSQELLTLATTAPPAPGPVTQSDSASVVSGASVGIDVLANDSAASGLNPGSVEVVAAPAAGTIDAIDAQSGEILYRHNGATGSGDSFSYRVQDYAGNWSGATPVSVTVQGYQPATVTITSPADGQNLSGNLVVYWQLSGDSNAYDHIHVKLDDNPHVTLHNTALTSYDFGQVSVGSHQVQVWLVDSSHVALPNPEASQTITIQVVDGSVDPDLLGYWPMDALPGGLVNDASGNGRSGTAFGASLTAGRFGSGLSFNGVDNWVSVPHDAGLAFGAGDAFTLSAWVNPAASQGGWSGVVTKSRDQSPWYGLWISSWNAWTFGGPSALYGSGISSGWHHLALVQASGSRSLYLNGVEIASGAAREGTGSGELWFGGAAGISEFFDGVLDEVRLYGRGFSAAEVVALMNLEPGSGNPSAGNDSALVTQGQAVTIAILANDSAPAGWDLDSFELVSAPAYGSIDYDAATGSLSYQHDGSASSSDSFSYRLADQNGTVSNTAEVSVAIEPYQAPALVITAPIDGSEVSGNLVVSWNRSGDASGYNHVHVQLDDQAYVPVHDLSLSSYDFGAVAPGSHLVQVWLVDENHQPLTNPESGDSITVTVAALATVAAPVISPAGGSFSGPVAVTLSSSTPLARVYYTLDGSDPDVGSDEYLSVLTLDQSVTLKAIALADGLSDSSISSAQFDIDLSGGGLPSVGLVGYWPLDEAGGDSVLDASGNGRVGSLSGASRVPGWAGGGLSFDGGDDQVRIGHESALAFAVGDSFTLSVWVNADGPQGGWSGVVTKSRDSAPWYGLWVSSWNAWVFGGPANLADGSISSGWTQLTLVQNGPAGTRTLYRDGAVVASGSAQPADGNGDLIFGGADGVSEFFSGTLDEVRLYDRALTGDEIQALATLPP